MVKNRLICSYPAIQMYLYGHHLRRHFAHMPIGGADRWGKGRSRRVVFGLDGIFPAGQPENQSLPKPVCFFRYNS